MSRRFAFLVLDEHPYGRQMLRILLQQGHQPGLIVEEASAVADEERDKFLTRIAGQPLPPTFTELLSDVDIPRLSVDNHNSPACREMLGGFGPELVVLGGTRILRPHILEVPPLGTINAHPGLLPRLRGSSSVGWALYKDLPVGSTVHYLDKGIDTGPIILKRELPVRRDQTYEQIVRRVLTLSGELMAEALALLATGGVAPTRQDPAAGETLRLIPADYLAEAKARLAQGHYSHFAG